MSEYKVGRISFGPSVGNVGIDWRSYQQGLVQGVSQIDGRSGGHPQISDSLSSRVDPTFSGGLNQAGGQQNVYETSVIAEGRANLEIQNRRFDHSLNRDEPGSLGFFSHHKPPSLKTRFGRACRAFVNAWKAASQSDRVRV